MPKIELPPLPSSGSDLLRTGGQSSIREPYTQSIYVADGLPGPNNGLMSTANGRLTITNLADNFSVKAEHIQPEQASLARSDSMTASSTIYGNGSVDPVIGVQAGSQFFDLPGCAVRWYQPYATSMSLMQWSFFVSYNCWRGAYKNLRLHILRITAKKTGLSFTVRNTCIGSQRADAEFRQARPFRKYISPSLVIKAIARPYLRNGINSSGRQRVEHVMG